MSVLRGSAEERAALEAHPHACELTDLWLKALADAGCVPTALVYWEQVAAFAKLLDNGVIVYTPERAG